MSLLIPPDAPSVETVRLDPPGVEIAVADCF